MSYAISSRKSGLLAGAGRFRNDVTVGGTGTGAEVIAREPARPLIQTLFEYMPLLRAGSTLAMGLAGDLPLPAVSRSVALPIEKAETAASTELSPGTSMVTLEPRRIPGHVDVSVMFIKQTKGGETLLRNYIAQELAVRWEAQAISGSGTGDNMLEILNTPGIGNVAGGPNGLAPTWSHITALEKAVSTNDDFGRRYLTNSAVRRRLKETARNSTGSAFVWPDTLEPSLNGYPALTSDLVPANLTKGSASGVCSAIIHGDFRDLVLAQWGGMQFLVDYYTFDTTGMVRLICALYVDSAVTRVTSFAAMQDALTA